MDLFILGLTHKQTVDTVFTLSKVKVHHIHISYQKRKKNKETMKPVLSAFLVFALPYSRAQTATSTTPASCAQVVSTHTFAGDCCALTDEDNGGCRITVVGGTCTVTGPNLGGVLTSMSNDACPATEYNVLGDCQADKDCGTRFCGTDGACYPYTCANFFQLHPAMEYDSATATDLMCESAVKDFDLVHYACGRTNSGLVADPGVGMKSNQFCTGQSRSDDEFGIAVECFDYEANTDFSAFTMDALGAGVTCVGGSAFFHYQAGYDISEFENGSLVRTSFVKQGPLSTAMFDEPSAYGSMFAVITRTAVTPPPTKAPTDVPTIAPSASPSDPPSDDAVTARTGFLWLAGIVGSLILMFN